MSPRVFILSLCVAIAFAGCEKDPNEEENQTPQPTPTPRRAVKIIPTPAVTPWAPISKSKGPDTTWLYRQPPPEATPSTLKPFHSSLDDSPQKSGGLKPKIK